MRFAGLQVDAIIHERVHSQIFVDFSQSKLTLYDAWVVFSAYGDAPARPTEDTLIVRFQMVL